MEMSKTWSLPTTGRKSSEKQLPAISVWARAGAARPRNTTATTTDKPPVTKRRTIIVASRAMYASLYALQTRKSIAVQRTPRVFARMAMHRRALVARGPRAYAAADAFGWRWPRRSSHLARRRVRRGGCAGVSSDPGGQLARAARHDRRRR